MNKGLGKGLGAIISSNVEAESDQVTEAPVAKIRPNPYQPRREFDAAALQELAESIKEHGIISPLIVRKSIKGFELVAGERRLRAAKEAGLAKVPIIVKEYTDQQLMEIALIENLQREDLNPLEEAEAYEKLIQHYSYTQDALAKKLGKSRPHVSNILRLLHLPDKIKQLVTQGALSMGHARALIAVEDQELQWKLANETITKGLSVRQLEELVQQMNVSRETKAKKNAKKDKALVQLEERLRNRLGTSVHIKKGNKKGKIEIEFFSQEDLERILELLQAE
ncbi:ParB/RepB/Spo0J family partition protein [Brevibacillus fluminis]|uniref:ParB/RepB/Spo0J family partition protein n=1 Tax=Brevibacillus fluminis TaxID=511487 RepID=A0A3M8D5W1_9BACL|nr:ParB/RepB/Spo0J family partition protein [Brevibacillus fluminis]RNB83430.1 ParB/RepB/Spo0J family partition protein [Brevibacillus fluminis]